MKPIVAIIGRPNVGKSALFNRLIQKRLAIVDRIPGVTRDRLYGDTEWLGKEFTLVDTGGLLFGEEEIMSSATLEQAEVAMAEADIILLVVDAQAGVTAGDEAVADRLRQARKPIILVGNKVDSPRFQENVYDLYRLGLGEPVAVSAMHGSGTGDLLDEIVSVMPSAPDAGTEESEEGRAAVALVGQPNVGKSSIVNSLLGWDRVIVTDVPGTTRDAIDVHCEIDGSRFTFIDTAGMRRKAKVKAPLERFSVIRSLRAVDRCDVAVLVLDATQGVVEQDTKIAGYVHEQGRGLVIVINKWDLVEKDTYTMAKFTDDIRHQLSFVDYAPLVFTSALTKQRVNRIPEVVLGVVDQQEKRVATAALNEVVDQAFDHHPPPAFKGKRLKIYYATQPAIKPPTFIFFVNNSRLVHFSYKRYLENRLRAAFGFEGTPIWIKFRGRGNEGQ